MSEDVLVPGPATFAGWLAACAGGGDGLTGEALIQRATELAHLHGCPVPHRGTEAWDVYVLPVLQDLVVQARRPRGGGRAGVRERSLRRELGRLEDPTRCRPPRQELFDLAAGRRWPRAT